MIHAHTASVNIKLVPALSQNTEEGGRENLHLLCTAKQRSSFSCSAPAVPHYHHLDPSRGQFSQKQTHNTAAKVTRHCSNVSVYLEFPCVKDFVWFCGNSWHFQDASTNIRVFIYRSCKTQKNTLTRGERNIWTCGADIPTETTDWVISDLKLCCPMVTHNKLRPFRVVEKTWHIC